MTVKHRRTSGIVSEVGGTDRAVWPVLCHVIS